MIALSGNKDSDPSHTEAHAFETKRIYFNFQAILYTVPLFHVRDDALVVLPAGTAA